jgi:hypothetical protein
LSVSRLSISISRAAGTVSYEMNADLDLRTICRPGAVCRTRDRREARILSQDGGLISGEVQMHGPCIWLSDGRYRDAPFGAAGPLDLMPPQPATVGERQTATLAEAMAAGDRLFCCD